MTATILLVLMMASITLIALPQSVQAVDKIWMTNQSITVPAGVTINYTSATVPYISFRPNPIGIGQELLIQAWVSPSVETNRKLFLNNTDAYRVTITKPDGTKEPYIKFGVAESTLTIWNSYIPTQVGEYKIQFEFLGTYFPEQYIETTLSFGAAAGTTLGSLYLAPSKSKEYTFTVQNDMISSWPPAPLPNDYWTYPVDFSLREWYPILGSWPPTGYQVRDWGDYWYSLYPDTNPTYIPRGMFIPFVQGPNSAHVLRTKTELTGGIQGATAGITGQFSDAGYPSVVYMGRCYQTVTKVMPVLINGTYRQLPTSVATSFNLQTGEVYYDIPIADGGVTPTMVVYNEGTSAQSDVLTYSIELATISGSRLYKINQATGAVTTNVSISGLPGTTLQNQRDGYIVGVQNIGNTTVPNYRLINWTITGSSTDITSRVVSNTSYARSSLPSFIDWNVGLGANVAQNEIYGTRIAQTITGINAYTGAEIWGPVRVEAPQYSGSCTIADNGKICILSMWGNLIALNLADGKIAWESPTMNYPWGATAFGVYGVASAYGMVFRPSYDGIYAYNWTDGSQVWFAPRYPPAPFESPYTEYAGGPETYPGQTAVRIADGKVYIYDGEHSPQQPRTRGWSLYAFDVYTGKQLWKFAIGGSIMFGSEPSIGPIIDGYLYMPATNGITYIIGRGKSATTVTAPDVAVPLGTAFTIKGTVLDQSPAQPNTACVSKDSMTTQMNYLHLQYPVDGIWHNETILGVPVALSAIDSNGNYIDIGTTTTNGYYGSFGMSWTPPKQDTYTIMATFATDESYGSSGASTAVTVGPAPTIAPTQEPTQAPADNTGLLYATLAAVIIAIAISLFTLFRKR